jgi:predicted anti-sigma-YlaC factor YlaD
MTCEIVKDLIPMYVDKTASEETIEAVSNHIKTCTDCRNFCRFCRAAEDRSRHVNNENVIHFIKQKESKDEIEEKYATLSRKLKRRKTLHIILSALVVAGLAAYVVADLINSSKNKQ